MRTSNPRIHRRAGPESNAISAVTVIGQRKKTNNSIRSKLRSRGEKYQGHTPQREPEKRTSNTNAIRAMQIPIRVFCQICVRQFRRAANPALGTDLRFCSRKNRRCDSCCRRTVVVSGHGQCGFHLQTPYAVLRCTTWLSACCYQSISIAASDPTVIPRTDQ